MFKKISVVISSILILFICIGLMPTNKVNAEEHSHNVTFSQAIEDVKDDTEYYKLNSGDYYLDSDYSLDKKVKIDDGVTVNICLNGNVLNIKEFKFEIVKGGTLNIYSCNSTNNHYFNIIQDLENDFIDGLWRITDQVTTNVIKGGVITNSENGEYIYSIFENYGTMSIDTVNFVGINTHQQVILSGNGSVLNIYNSKFIGNRGDSGSGVIRNMGELNIYNSEFKYNKTSQYGGAVHSSGRALIKDSVIQNNKALNGGGILNEKGILTLINTRITNNTATSNGGGVTSCLGMCLKEGSKILMGDGSLSNIEDVKENDYIKSFNHFTGELVNEKVYVAYKSKGQGKAFTLHFEDGDELNIVGVHDLFSKTKMNYVDICEVNAEEFIGDYFYDAVNNKWDKLVSVTYDEDLSNYYSLYTEHNFNCIANNMLTVPDDGVAFLKIFKFNCNLIVDQEQLNKDIEKYGLYDYEDDGYITKEQYDVCNLKYLNIVIGKGIATFEELIGYSEEAKEIKEKNNITLSIIDLFSSIFKTNKVSADDEITCNTYADDELEGVVILGSNVIIKNNTVNSKTDNLYLKQNSYIYFIDETKDLDIGINHALSSAEFTKENNSNYLKYFTSDSDLYKVIHNGENVLKLDRAYNFTALTSDTTKIDLDGVTEDKAKEISSFYLTTEKVSGVVVVYGKVGDNYSTITYDGSAWQSTGPTSLSDLKTAGTVYVIGLIKEDSKKLISEDEEDCEVKSDGKGYAEYTVGKGKDTIIHIDGFSSTSDYNSLTITCGNRYLKDDEYEVFNGSIKVKLLEDFINTLNVGTNLVKIEVTKGAAKYLFELNIKINPANTDNIDYKVVKTSTY